MYKPTIWILACNVSPSHTSCCYMLNGICKHEFAGPLASGVLDLS